jgi:hypothetical protein
MNEIILKTCKTCGTVKNLLLFVKCKTKGYRSPCKECANIKNKERNKNRSDEAKARRKYSLKLWRLKNRDKLNAQSKIYRDRSPPRTEYNKEYASSAHGKIRMDAGIAAYKARNPLKRMAHILVNNAIAGGHITRQPCSICGDPKAQAHHDDYAKPLEIRWLCVKHHTQFHSDQRAIERNSSKDGL